MLSGTSYAADEHFLRFQHPLQCPLLVLPSTCVHSKCCSINASLYRLSTCLCCNSSGKHHAFHAWQVLK